VLQVLPSFIKLLILMGILNLRLEQRNAMDQVGPLSYSKNPLQLELHSSSLFEAYRIGNSMSELFVRPI